MKNSSSEVIAKVRIVYDESKNKATEYQVIRENDSLFFYNSMMYKEISKDSKCELVIIFDNQKLKLYSNLLYLQIPIPNNQGPFKYYLNGLMHDDQILIGENYSFKMSSDTKNSEIRIIGTSYFYDEKTRKYQMGDTIERISSIKNIFNLGRETEFIKQFELQNGSISRSHCYVGYDLDVKMFYVIDYGSKGEGSSNHTFAKIKEEQPFIITNFSERYLFRVFTDAADYLFEVKFENIKTIDNTVPLKPQLGKKQHLKMEEDEEEGVTEKGMHF